MFPITPTLRPAVPPQLVVVVVLVVQKEVFTPPYARLQLPRIACQLFLPLASSSVVV